MPDPAHRVEALIVTSEFHIRGDLVSAPDGSMLELEHRVDQSFLRVFNAEFISRADGRRVYDVREAFVNRSSIVAVFREEDVAFVRRAAAQPAMPQAAPSQTPNADKS